MNVFTHSVFVTNNQISKYLEAFSRKGLCYIKVLTVLKKIKKKSECLVNCRSRSFLLKLHECVKNP